MSILSQHVGHRLTTEDGKTLRCLDCTHTLILEAPVAPKARFLQPPRPDEACPEHPGYWPDNCGACRSERIAIVGDEDLV